MPEFQRLSLGEAQLQSGTGKRAQLIREYVAYVEQVEMGQAGKLTPAPGESVTAVRRRLTLAASHLGRELVVKRTKDDTIIFWLDTGERPRRRRRTREEMAADAAAQAQQ